MLRVDNLDVCTEKNPVPVMPALSLYETDFYAWTQAQAALLRNHQWKQLDLQNLIEEIESLGKQQRQELRSRLSVLIGHLLKWEYQPQRRSRSWLATIRIQRLDISELLEENPTCLKPYLEEALQKAYLKNVVLAVGETDLPDSTFPAECPYSLIEILGDAFGGSRLRSMRSAHSDHRFYPGEPTELISESE